MFGKHEESWSRKLNSGQREKQYFMAGKYFLFLFEGKHFPLVTKKKTSSTVQNTNPSLSLSLSQISYRTVEASLSSSSR
jgi:hypothetical protein